MESSIRGAAMPIYEGLSNRLAKRIAAHNAQVEQLQATDNFHDSAVERFASGELGADDFATTCDSRRLNQLVGVEAAVKIWRERGQLANEAKAELAAKVTPLEAAAAKALASTREGLERLGLGLESQQAWPVNRESAQRQLDHVAERALPVKAAQRDLENARARVKAAHGAAVESKRGEEAALAALRRRAELAAA